MDEEDDRIRRHRARHSGEAEAQHMDRRGILVAEVHSHRLLEEHGCGEDCGSGHDHSSRRDEESGVGRKDRSHEVEEGHGDRSSLLVHHIHHRMDDDLENEICHAEDRGTRAVLQLVPVSSVKIELGLLGSFILHQLCMTQWLP